jgi:hypothetical protein
MRGIFFVERRRERRRTGWVGLFGEEGEQDIENRGKEIVWGRNEVGTDGRDGEDLDGEEDERIFRFPIRQEVRVAKVWVDRGVLSA